MAINKSEMKSYWNGYRAMKNAFENTGELNGSMNEIYQSNAGNMYVKGAQLAAKRIKEAKEKAMNN